MTAVLQQAGAEAQPMAKAIGEQVAQSGVIGSNETSTRVVGRTWWQWVFRSVVGVESLMRASREAQVIEEVMGTHQAAWWVSEGLSAHLSAPAEQRQICLAHQLRDLERLRRAPAAVAVGSCPAGPVSGSDPSGEATSGVIAAGLCAAGDREREHRLEELLQRRVRGTLAYRLQKCYRRHRAHLLVVLHCPDVPPDNNACERALRLSVIHRKVTNGFRSAWRAHAYAALATV